MLHNQPPFAKRISMPPGPLDAALPRQVFGDDYLLGETYYSDGKYVRRIVTEEEARMMDLGFYFDAQPCRYGHIAPRKLFKHKRQTQCMACRNIHRKRAAKRKPEQEAA